MVYLLRKGIPTTRPNNKLDYKKLGPFKIEEKISTSNYKLSLPASMRMHPIFHISLLEPAPQGSENVEPRLEVETYEEDYEVEEILDKKRMDGETKYLVKWKNYEEHDNSWEPVKHLKNSQHLLKRFHQQLRTAQANLDL
jgi:hypothetical protein